MCGGKKLFCLYEDIPVPAVCSLCTKQNTLHVGIALCSTEAPVRGEIGSFASSDKESLSVAEIVQISDPKCCVWEEALALWSGDGNQYPEFCHWCVRSLEHSLPSNSTYTAGPPQNSESDMMSVVITTKHKPVNTRASFWVWFKVFKMIFFLF